MANINTPYGTIIINPDAPKELIDCALQALINPTKHSLKDMILCDNYDDEVRRDCQLALDGMLIATPEELEFAKQILFERMGCEEAQKLFA